MNNWSQDGWSLGRFETWISWMLQKWYCLDSDVQCTSSSSQGLSVRWQTDRNTATASSKLGQHELSIGSTQFQSQLMHQLSWLVIFITLFTVSIQIAAWMDGTNLWSLLLLCSSSLNLRNSVFWDMMSCSLVDHYQQFGGLCCLHFLPWRCTQHVPPKVGNILPDYTASHPRTLFIITTARTSYLISLSLFYAK